jgi:hypothetical protein
MVVVVVVRVRRMCSAEASKGVISELSPNVPRLILIPPARPDPSSPIIFFYSSYSSDQYLEAAAMGR